MRFSCKRYPQLIVYIGGERFIRFSCGIYETADTTVAEVLKRIDYIELLDEPTEPVKKARKQAKNDSPLQK